MPAPPLSTAVSAECDGRRKSPTKPQICLFESTRDLRSTQVRTQRGPTSPSYSKLSLVFPRVPSTSQCPDVSQVPRGTPVSVQCVAAAMPQRVVSGLVPQPVPASMPAACKREVGRPDEGDDVAHGQPQVERHREADEVRRKPHLCTADRSRPRQACSEKRVHACHHSTCHRPRATCNNTRGERGGLHPP